MMEFTLSRVALGVCGLMLLAAVLSPVTFVYDGRETAGLQDQADGIARMIDSFYGSAADEMTLSMSEILPTQDSVLELDGQLVVLRCGEKECRSSVRCNIDSDGSYWAGDLVKFEKTDTGVSAGLLMPRTPR
jgi:hypothetical protein